MHISKYIHRMASQTPETAGKEFGMVVQNQVSENFERILFMKVLK